MTPTITHRLTGHDAIATAEANDLALSKHADPIDPARAGLSVEDALDIAEADPGLIYLDVVMPAPLPRGAGPTLVIRETQLGDPADYPGVTLTHGVLVF